MDKKLDPFQKIIIFIFCVMIILGFATILLLDANTKHRNAAMTVINGSHHHIDARLSVIEKKIDRLSTEK